MKRNWPDKKPKRSVIERTRRQHARVGQLMILARRPSVLTGLRNK